MKNLSRFSIITLVFSILLLSFVLAEDGVTLTPASSNINTITVSDINVPASMVKGSSGSIDVLITNSGSKGMFLVTASSDQVSLNPSAQNIALDGQTTVHYTYSAQNLASSGKICIKVCTTNQFGNNGCTEQCKLFSIIDDAPAQNSSSNNATIIAVIVAVAIIIGFIIFAIILKGKKK